ncbi:MAG TPA: hypothetical protein PKE45_05415 [Caldilineaceae bacterium]|nr:hypothetical protein [Caldilineaceae bacterium]
MQTLCGSELPMQVAGGIGPNLNMQRGGLATLAAGNSALHQ